MGTRGSLGAPLGFSCGGVLVAVSASLVVYCFLSVDRFVRSHCFSTSVALPVPECLPVGPSPVSAFGGLRTRPPPPSPPVSFLRLSSVGIGLLRALRFDSLFPRFPRMSAAARGPIGCSDAEGCLLTDSAEVRHPTA